MRVLRAKFFTYEGAFQMEWWMLLPIAATLLYIGVVALWLPTVFLQNKFKMKSVNDRGIRKYKSGGDSIGILYEPEVGTRKYIKQYAISFDGEEKLLKCMLADDIDYIEYDVASFNRNGKIINVLNVKDVVEKAGFTRSVILPRETAYVALVISRVDDMELDVPVKLLISKGKMLLYSLVTVVLSVLTAFAIKIGIALSLGGVFRESFLMSLEGHILTLGFAFLLSLAGAIFVAIALAVKNSSNNRKAAKKSSKNKKARK